MMSEVERLIQNRFSLFDWLQDVSSIGKSEDHLVITKAEARQIIDAFLKVEVAWNNYKKQLQERLEANRRIAKTTKSDLWREGARWNITLLEELLGEFEK